MERRGEDPVIEAILSLVEVAVAAEINDTRLMGEQLRVERAQLETKERQLEMQKSNKARAVAIKEANEKLVTDFLKADSAQDFEKQKAMKDDIEASMSPDVAKLVDAVLDGHAHNSSDDPKAMTEALLALLKSDSG